MWLLETKKVNMDSVQVRLLKFQMQSRKLLKLQREIHMNSTSLRVEPLLTKLLVSSEHVKYSLNQLLKVPVLLLVVQSELS